MAKITIGRLPQATVEYERSQFDTLIRELEQIITQLNFSYEQQTKDETLARSWFIG
jgi:chromosomal replication initiation ATPase DnaA|tara:strand:+ start:832 stop:999 length:168 start_codon:yes stop_codon:yes gene_type:complete